MGTLISGIALRIQELERLDFNSAMIITLTVFVMNGLLAVAAFIMFYSEVLLPFAEVISNKYGACLTKWAKRCCCCFVICCCRKKQISPEERVYSDEDGSDSDEADEDSS